MKNKKSIGKQAMAESIELLREFYYSKIKPNKCQNERYLHHYYSNKMQECFKIDICNMRESKLHPEWPTHKKATGILFSKYKKNDEGKYFVDVDDGSSGFIDFAIGEYDKPAFAIEFTSKYGLNSEDLIFDFLKLLDEKNSSFEWVISFNLIYREKGLPKNENKIKTALNKAISELKDRGAIAENRHFLFWIIEIASNGGEPRSWFLYDINKSFEKVFT